MKITTLTFEKILAFINSKEYIVNNSKIEIYGFKSIFSAKKGEMTFCSYMGDKALQLISSSTASIIICHKSLVDNLKKSKSNIIFVNRPRLWFLRCVNEFSNKEKLSGIHKTAVLESAKIGKNVYIGPHTYVAKTVSIGDNTIIHGNVYIYNNVKIGKNVIIHAGTVIGSDGFGYEINEKKQLEKFPHIGGVEIHNNVEIGANNCIDRGALENTIVGKGTKTDNHVHIAHNVKIGKNCVFTANVTTSGSIIIDDGVYIGTGATLRDWIHIGKNAFIGLGSVVVKDVPAGTTVMGVPAHPIKKKMVFGGH